MKKPLTIVLFTLSVLFIKTRAISVVNNVTMPSDILTNIFIAEIQNNNSILSDVTVQSAGRYNTLKCAAALQEIVNRFPSLDVLPFIDSWGSLPSGILFGHLTDMGNFDQCVRISKTLNAVAGTVNGQYCWASVPLIQNQVAVDPDILYDPQVRDSTLDYISSIKVGICIPDVCDPNYVQVILQSAADNIFNGALAGIKVARCITEKKQDLEAVNIAGIVVFAIIGCLMVLCTLYDFYTRYCSKPVVPLLLAFSVYTNGRKLFAINTTKQPNSIDCLIGIRVLSMIWVVYCHNYVMYGILPMTNLIDLLPWSKAASSMHVLNATVSVDTFLFISGLLVAWIGLRELDKSKGKLNIPLMYFHRYIRLTPAVGAVILFFVSINSLIGSGPYRKPYEIFQKDCHTTWWSTLLYVQNYVNPESICVGQTWYLAVDTQLYVLSPLILIPLWKWGRKCIPVIVILSLLSIGCVIGTYFTEGFTQFIGTLEDNQFKLTYVPTHTRYSVWLIGILFGYFLHTNRNKPLVLSKPLQLIGWTVCFVTILSIIYGPYFTIHSDRSSTVFEAAIYESLKRSAWAVAVGWIVFACYSGFGGVINSMLSHPWWQPLGRLTYSLYLVHMAVQCINFGITRTDVFFSNYQMILIFWSTFGISVMAAIILSLGFESPILVIEKTILGSKKAKPQEPNPTIVKIHKSESTESTQKTA